MTDRTEGFRNSLHPKRANHAHAAQVLRARYLDISRVAEVKYSIQGSMRLPDARKEASVQEISG